MQRFSTNSIYFLAQYQWIVRVGQILTTATLYGLAVHYAEMDNIDDDMDDDN